MSNVRQLFKVEPWQIRKIHAMKRGVFPSDVEYRAALESYGVKSSTELSYGQAQDFIGVLEPHAKREPVKRVYGKGKRGLNANLTQAQAERILILSRLAGMNEVRLFGYIRRVCKGKLKAIQMLTNQEASNVIIAMQNFCSPEYAKKINRLNNKELRLLLKEMEKSESAAN